jgi:hypothetical protein
VTVQHGWRAVFPNGETCSIYPTAHEIVAWKQLTIEFGRPEDDLRSDGWRMEPITITPRGVGVQEPEDK